MLGDTVMTDSLSSNISARRLLLTAEDVGVALGPDVAVRAATAQQPEGSGQMLRAAARDSAYASLAGETAHGSETHVFRIGVLALVFADERQAGITFDHVAEATHLRTEIEGSRVAVETVKGAGGTVSYWGYLCREDTIVVVTLDTNAPERFTIADLRSLVQIEVQKLRSG